MNLVMLLLFSFITRGEGVEVGVVDQTVVSIAPGEGLSTNSHVVVLLELRSVWVLGQAESIDVAKDTDGNSDDEEGLLPGLIAVSSVSARHAPHWGRQRATLGQNSGAISNKTSHS